MMNNFYVSTLIKELRTSFGYTIENVANILGVSKAAVSKWENGDDIATDHLYDLAKLYNVSFSELYNGKLYREDNNDYWRRNYDLSNFEFDGVINNKNVDLLKKLFEHCVLVKNKFYELLPKWANNELSINESEEFGFIKQYFKFDINYYAYIKYGPRHLAFADEHKEKEFVIEALKNISGIPLDKYMWELEKLYNFTYDYKSDEICKSGNLKALEYMLSSFSQIEKDSILYENIHLEEKVEEKSLFGGKQSSTKYRNRTIEEIESIPFFKVMLDSGANVLYQYKSFGNTWDREMFDKIEGDSVKIDISIYSKYLFYDFTGETKIPILENWKLFSYDEYLEFVDKRTTDFYKDIVNIKDGKPLEYYEKMVRRNEIND